MFWRASFVVLVALTMTAHAGTYHVATDGKPENDGSTATSCATTPATGCNLCLPKPKYQGPHGLAGEAISWTVNGTSSSAQIKITLLAGGRLVAEQTGQAGSGPLRGTFAGGGLTPGIYTLQAAITVPQRFPLAARRQVIVAPNPFDWQQPTPRRLE